MSTPERRIIEAVAESISTGFAEYLTPPKYEAKHLLQDKKVVVRQHFPRITFNGDGEATVGCECGLDFASETLWSDHLADKLFPA